METVKPRILIVDDTPENIHVLMGTLRDEYVVTAATSGEKALRLATGDHPPDLILLDVMMPGMDGYEVIRRLRGDVRTREIPVIFVTALTDETDELRGFELGAVDFITKPVSPPKVRARVRTHLTLQAARKTLEGQNRELVEAARLREDVDRIMRHDLKSPLNAIIGVPRLLLTQEGRDRREDEPLRMIEEAGYRMLRMINLSLDMMKMERGSYPLEPVAVDLVDLLGKIAREAAPLAGAKGMDLCVTVDGRPAEDREQFVVFGEELLCYSMVSNLVKNAVEASPDGCPVRIDLRHGPVAAICIRNAGMVPEGIRDRFFEKFVTAEKSGGTGLGTYSARLIAQTQGGTVVLDTSEAGYTTITVRLPVPPKIDSAAVALAGSRPEGSPGRSRIGEMALPPLRVLVADDDPFAIEIFKRRLSQLKIAADEASNGREAAEKCAAERYDLVFMDLEMPVLDGLRAVREIRSTERADGRRPSFILAVSAHDDATSRDRALSAGFDRYLVKPVPDESLHRVFSRFAVASTASDLTPLERARPASNAGPYPESAHHQETVVVDADLRDLIPGFLDNKRTEISEIDSLLDRKDFDGVRRIGHKLKGSFTVYGFTEAGRMGADMESAAEGRDSNRIQWIAETLLRHLEHVVVQFEENP